MEDDGRYKAAWRRGLSQFWKGMETKMIPAWKTGERV